MYCGCEIMFVNTMTGAEKCWNLNLKLLQIKLAQKNVTVTFAYKSHRTINNPCC